MMDQEEIAVNKTYLDDTESRAVLGVDDDADASEIKRAYRRLARLFHPDRNPGDARALARFLKVRAAYEVLHAEYRHAQQPRRPISWYERAQQYGYDVELTIILTLAEARSGVTRSASFHRPDGKPYTIPSPVPAGIHSGERVRIASAGGPNANGTQRGDLYIRVMVERSA